MHNLFETCDVAKPNVFSVCSSEGVEVVFLASSISVRISRDSQFFHGLSLKIGFCIDINPPCPLY